jgi:hypothetical protein
MHQESQYYQSTGAKRRHQSSNNPSLLIQTVCGTKIGINALTLPKIFRGASSFGIVLGTAKCLQRVESDASKNSKADLPAN